MNKISRKRMKKYSAYRFTARLLAVLMLFSALLAGSMTVHAETAGVAQIGSETYASVEAAVSAANEATTAVEIDLLVNTAIKSDVTINDNITLDLNGKTLDLGSYNLSLSTSAKVVDNSNTKAGLLTTSGGKLNSSTQMAVYDTTNSGYVVADIKHQEAILSEASTGTFKLVFKPDFGETANSLLGNSGTEAKVSVQILLSWDGGSQTFTYDSDMIKNVYANSGRAFYITVTNFANVANVKVTPKIVSDLGADCRGTACTLTEATVVNKPVINITTQPTDAEVIVGNTATLTVAATATENADVTYQWYSCEDANKTNATAVSGATSATYEVTPTAVGTVYYYCEVSAEGATSVTSSVVAVTVPVLFSEDFDSESFKLAAWSTTSGICLGGSGDASVGVVEQKLQISKSTAANANNIDARWSGETVASSYADKKVIYEFTLKLTADTKTNVIVALRSNASESSTTNTPSYLFEISNNGLYVRDSSNSNVGIASLSAGEYKIKVEVDFKNKTRDIYVNGTEDKGGSVNYEKTKLGMHKAGEFKAEYMNSLLRFIISSNKETDFSIDDILIYEVALSEDTE